MATAGRSPTAVAVLVVLLTLTHASAQYASDDSFNLDPQNKFLYEPCLRGEKKGLCLNDYQCLPNYTMSIGGDIINTEVRDGGPRLRNCGQDLWCCTYPEEEQGPSTKPATPKTPPSQGGSCSRVFDRCPWCVALYREGGDVSRGHVGEGGLYCGGAVIGSRVVLTAATCVRTVQEETVRVRVPYSNAPDKFYTVVNKITHPNYSSGTHANDFALMLLNEDVQWKAGFSGGACLDFSAPQGDCQIIGFSLKDEIVMNPVSLQDGVCRKKRGGSTSAEVMCASAKVKGQCGATSGLPLLCPPNNGRGGLAIAGVARMPCIKDNALLGKVLPHSAWLVEELKKLGVESAVYSP